MTAIQRRLTQQFSGKLIPIRHYPVYPPMPVLQRIPFQVQGGVLFVDPGQVHFLEANSNYTNIHFAAGKSTLVSKTLKYCGMVFPSSFLRIHKSFLINPDFLRFYNKSESVAELDAGVRLPVSRSGKEVLRMII